MGAELNGILGLEASGHGTEFCLWSHFLCRWLCVCAGPRKPKTLVSERMGW